MEKIGPYEIVETLQAGAKPLYRARTADGRRIVLKTLPLEDMSEEVRAQFLGEAESLKRSDLVRVLEVAEAHGVLYQAVELPEDVDLQILVGERAATPDAKENVKRAAYQAQRPASPVSLPPPPKPKSIIPSVQMMRPPELSNLRGTGKPATPAKSRAWGLYIAIAVAIVLAVALVAVLVTK